MRAMPRLLLCLAALLPALHPASAQELPETLKGPMLESCQRSCEESQSANQSNLRHGEDVIRAYCACTCADLVDMTSREDLDSWDMRQPPSPELRQQMIASAQRCAAEIRR